MPISDNNKIFSNAQSLGSVGTFISTNVLDLGSLNIPVQNKQSLPRYMPQDFDIYMALSALLTGTSTTLTVSLISSDSSSMSSPVIHDTAPVIAVGDTTRNRLDVKIPILRVEDTPQGGFLRYLAFQYVLAGTSPTVSINAWPVYANDFNRLS